MCCNTYPSKTYYADYTMSLNDEKVQLYGEFAKIDPFEFWDLDLIDTKLSKHLSKLKKRHWMYIVYPESAPKDWMQQLEATGVKFAVSPLHDKDKLVDGKYKKKHWHVILVFDGPTTFMTAASYIGITNGPYPKVCESLRGAFEYFTHKNDPEKAQYSPDDIKVFNGFEIDLSAKDVQKIKKELCNLIIEHNMTEYMEFNLYVQYCLEEEYFDVASNNTYYFNSLITSMRHNPNKIVERYNAIKEEVSTVSKDNKEEQEHDS